MKNSFKNFEKVLAILLDMGYDIQVLSAEQV